MEANSSIPVSPLDASRIAENDALRATQISLPSPALQPELSGLRVSIDEGQETAPGVNTGLLDPAHHVNSIPYSPTIVPQSGSRDPDDTQVWPKRHIHKWKSPLLMVLFFTLGAAVSVAHCVFYPKLNGRIVGDSNQQEEKIRYGNGSASGALLTPAGLAPRVPSLRKHVWGVVSGQSTLSGFGER